MSERSSRCLVLFLGLAVAACVEPTSPNLGLQRLLQSEKEEFIEVDGAGRWAQLHALPTVLRQTVELPAAARLSLPWTITDLDPSLGEATVEIEVVAHKGDDLHLLFQTAHTLEGQQGWFDESVNLSAVGPGQVVLEIRFQTAEASIHSQPLNKARVAVSPPLLWSADPEWHAAQRPDVVLIAIDTLRADHLSPYGSKRPTPNIERLAASGTVFEQAFSPAPRTLTSFFSVFTSAYFTTHGVNESQQAIPPGFTTLGQWFAINGYLTIGIHNGGYMRPVFGFNRGFDEYVNGSGFLGLRRRLRPRLEKAEGAPLLLFFHTYDVHDPYTTVPEEYHDTYTDPDYPDPYKLRGRRISGAELELPALGEGDFQFLRDLYDGEIHYVDDSLPVLFEMLDNYRGSRPRIVVFFADHGEAFGEQFQLAHDGRPRIELTHVPLILSGQGIPQGRRISEVVETLGLLPTLSELLGLSTDTLGGIDGRSFAYHLQADLVAADPSAAAVSQQGSDWALRTESWSLLSESGELQLYDRHADRAEQTNVVADHEEIAHRLDRLYQRRTRRVFRPGGVSVELDDEDLEDLRALGYVD